ncbi:MAG: amidinotransferase [Bacteroidales bacterium]|nr:amidinotransferase [Bacteroidales bacterium]
MVRPVAFGYNSQTAENNKFQQNGFEEGAQQKALEEFDNYVKELREAGIEVLVVEDTPEPHTPDSIFPNNWFSTHSAEELSSDDTQDGADGKSTIVLYPMFAPNRREERGKNVMERLKEHYGNSYNLVDFTESEKEGAFLEGTGSLILDRENKIAYACISPRTDEDLLDEWADRLGYDYCSFEATDDDGTPIYHTNVMMCIGSRYAIVCLDAIENIEERMTLIEVVEESGKEIFEITLEQMESFAGNMLELQGKDAMGKSRPVLVMSKTAKESLDSEQLHLLQNYATIVAPDLDCIEKNGGGSARCMIAEIF